MRQPYDSINTRLKKKLRNKMYMLPKIVFCVLLTSNIDLPLSIAVSFTLQQYQKSSACIIGPHMFCCKPVRSGVVLNGRLLRKVHSTTENPTCFYLHFVECLLVKIRGATSLHFEGAKMPANKVLLCIVNSGRQSGTWSALIASV